MRETWTFHSAGQLVFGANAVQQLGDIASRIGLKRVLVVTDPNLERAGIALRQYRVVRTKFKLDLFEKRYDIFFKT